jgi:molybdopterin synthase sulfur carrier subunit
MSEPTPLTVNVLFFARLRETVGTDQLRVMLPADATVDMLIDQLTTRGEQWQILRGEQPVMVAVNQTLCRYSHPLQEEDEVAFFPPVTGG